MNLPIKVKDFMQKDVVVFTEEMKVEEAIELLLKHRISGAPVVDQHHHPIGIISEKDCMNYILGGELPGLEVETVGELMSSKAEIVEGECTLLQIVNKFSTVSYRRFPVVDLEGKLVGIVSRGDVLKIVRDHKKKSRD